MNKVIIEVSGGVAYAVAASPSTEVMIVDWDNIKAGDYVMPTFSTVGSPGTIAFDAKLAEIKAEIDDYKKKKGVA